MGNFLGLLWNQVLYYPFINILVLLYSVLGENLGIAVIVMAIILRLLMIPFTKRQTDMTLKMADLKPRLDKLQEKYKHNQEKLAQEQVKLYKEVGYNPLGCLGSFVPQILVFMAIIAVIRALSSGDFQGLYPFVQDFVFGNADPILNTNFLFWDLSQNYQDVVAKVGYTSVESIAYFILAVLVGLSQYVSTQFTQLMQQADKPKANKKDGKKNEPMSPEEMQANMMKSMYIVMPLMTFSATLGAPAVLGIYWFTQVIMLIIQYFIIKKDKATAALKQMLSGIPFIGKRFDDNK